MRCSDKESVNPVKGASDGLLPAREQGQPTAILSNEKDPSCSNRVNALLLAGMIDQDERASLRQKTQERY